MDIIIIGMVLIIFSMGFLPIFAQLRLHEINTELFKKIKLNKLAPFFRCTGYGMFGEKGQIDKVKRYGIIIPMLIVQLIAYIIAFISITVVIILPLIFFVDLAHTLFILFVIFCTEMFIELCIMLIVIRVSKKRERRQYK